MAESDIVRPADRLVAAIERIYSYRMGTPPAATFPSGMRRARVTVWPDRYAFGVLPKITSWAKFGEDLKRVRDMSITFAPSNPREATIWNCVVPREVGKHPLRDENGAFDLTEAFSLGHKVPVGAVSQACRTYIVDPSPSDQSHFLI